MVIRIFCIFGILFLFASLSLSQSLFTFEDHFDSVTSSGNWHHTQDYRGGGVFEVVDGQFKRTTPGFVFYYNDGFTNGTGTYEFKAQGWWVFLWRGSTNAYSGKAVLIGSAGSSAEYLDYDEAVWSGYDHQYHNGSILRQERKFVGQYLRDSMNTIKIVDSGDSAKIYVNNELIHNVIISPDWRQDGYIEIGANGETDLTAFDDIVISGIINTSVKTIENTTPTTFRLQQNYPNPFNPITKIKYQIPEDTRVSFKIFNVLGEEIKTIVNEYQSAGYKEITFNGEDLPSGFYFYRLQTDKFTDVKKMLLVK